MKEILNIIKVKMRDFWLVLCGFFIAKKTEACETARANPIMFAALLFNIAFGLTAAVISLVKLSFYIGFTGSYSIILGITKYYALRKYVKVNSVQDANDAKNLENICAKNIGICTAALSFLHFSFSIVTTFIYDESFINYGFIILLFVSGSAFVKMTLAVIEAIRTRKNHSIIIHHVRLMSVASAFIALALAQRAILFYIGQPQAKLISGLIGILFSLLASFVCLSILLKKKSFAVN